MNSWRYLIWSVISCPEPLDRNFELDTSGTGLVFHKLESVIPATASISLERSHMMVGKWQKTQLDRIWAIKGGYGTAWEILVDVMVKVSPFSSQCQKSNANILAPDYLTNREFNRSLTMNQPWQWNLLVSKTLPNTRTRKLLGWNFSYCINSKG